MSSTVDHKTVLLIAAAAAIGTLGLVWVSKYRQLVRSTSAFLLEQIKNSKLTASEHGSVLPVTTEVFLVEQAGIAFETRLAAALAKKPELGARHGTPKSPFVPPFEPGMLVAELSSGHRVILNKFPVLELHVIVAAASESRSQNGPLTAADFWATREVLKAVGPDAVAFYNHGKESGFSQSHLHIQVVELKNFPLKLHYKERVLREQLPFKVGFVATQSPLLLADYVNEQLKRLGLSWAEDCSFNLLWTSEFLVLVPRTKASTDNALIALNGLSYSGSLFVKSQAALEFLSKATPLETLADLGLKQ